jgi:uncharacterized membrane protein
MSISHFHVIVFDQQDEAAKVLAALRQLSHTGNITLDDSAVVECDANGKIHVKHQMDRGVKIGAVAGGFIGLLLAGLFFPIAGLVIGAVGGGLIGASVGMGVDKKFVQEVKDSLKPGTSALFVITRDGNPAAVRAALEPFHGHVLQTSLDTEEEETLRRVLHDEQQSSMTPSTETPSPSTEASSPSATGTATPES